MEISVVGLRSSPSDWEEVRSLPREQLPALTEAQRAVAAKLGIPEEDYARSALAGRGNQDRLLQKTEKFARWLDRKIKERESGAAVARVALLTWEGKFDIEVRAAGRPVLFRVDEELVDRLFEAGSAEAGRSLQRVVELALEPEVA